MSNPDRHRPGGRRAKGQRTRHDAFAVCPPGVEEITAGELTALGVRVGRVERGGVSFAATTRQVYAANVWLRTATRVVVRIARFRADSFAELERAAAALDWDAWLPPDVAPIFRVTATSSKLYHTDAIAERLTRAARGPQPPAAGGTDDGDGPAARPLVVVRAVRDRFVVSVDASGDALHRRGWRQEVAKAPLRETLAAAVLLAAPWDPATGLIDPCCGSGTIPIEAALLARNRAPGLDRAFAFQRWPGFEPGTWASVVGEARAAERQPGDGPAAPVIVASDRDAGAVAAAAANARRAGVAGDLTVRVASVSDLARPAGPPGWLLTNPPYGERVSAGADLRNLYARLGAVARQQLPGWRVGLVVADRRLAGHTGLPLQARFATVHGGIPVELAVTPAPLDDPGGDGGA